MLRTGKGYAKITENGKTVRESLMSSNYDEWDQIYRKYPVKAWGWELGKPRPILVEFVEKGLIKKGKALDLCCGAGTNTVYLAKKGFEVTAIDISQRAIKYAKEKAGRANVKINFMIQSFVDLPFPDEEFDFVFDMGCFHHVEIEDRASFIEGVHRVLKKSGDYLLTCFSYKNGSAWNHFTEKQLISLFSGSFEINEIKHYSSIEGDGVRRYFYTVWMKKKE
jgi:ubiquinone/menaquinone biosynthesis C-methylase UbiE